MQIRPSRQDDLPAMLSIYDQAKEFMRESGNPNQWNGSYPEPELLLHDMELGNSYVMEENGQVIATFAFIKGADPTYARIENGAWLNEEPYGTVHRLASGRGTHGTAAACFDWCKMQCENGSGIRSLRADTHADNQVMQHLLEKNGFVRCGIIHLANGAPRIAYQYVKEKREQAMQQSPSPSQRSAGDGRPGMEQVSEERDRGFGIASLVLGIVSLVFFFTGINIPIAILAIALGAVQLTKKSPKGMAVAGMITGELAIFFTILMWMVIFLFHSFGTDVQTGYDSRAGYYDYYNNYDNNGNSRFYGQAPNGISQEYYQGYLDGYYDAYSNYH